MHTTTTIDRTPLVMAVCVLLALLGLFALAAAPVSMTVICLDAAALYGVSGRLLVRTDPRVRLGGAFGAVVLLLSGSALYRLAPSLLYITGWLVWGLFCAVVTAFLICLLAGWSRILLPPSTERRSPARFWGGVGAMAAAYALLAFYLTFIWV